MKRPGVVFLFAAVVLCATATASPAAQFTVEIVAKVTGAPTGTPASTVYYVKGVKERAVMRMSGSGRTTVEIRRPDKGVLWELDPKTKQYRQYPIARSDKATPAVDRLKERMSSLRRVGSEVIRGYRCDKYQCIASYGDISIPVTVWISPKLNMELKTESSYGGPHPMHQVTEPKSIVERPQPDWLFEIPAGYRKAPPDPAGGLPSTGLR